MTKSCPTFHAAINSSIDSSLYALLREFTQPKANEGIGYLLLGTSLPLDGTDD